MMIDSETAEAWIQVWYYEHQEQEANRLFSMFQDQINQQSKKIQCFIETLGALGEQYGQRLYAAKQLMAQYETALIASTASIDQLKEQKETVEEQIQKYEHDLPFLQQYQQQRHLKRLKRQRQYDTFYWIPLVAHQYKLKYMRARDKFAQAEHQVGQIRHATESCQKTLHRLNMSLQHTMEQHEQSRDHLHEIEKQWQQLKNTSDMLAEGQKFWYDFEKYQTAMVIKSLHYLIEQKEKQEDKNSMSSSTSTSSLTSHSEKMMMDAWIKTFKMACFEYNECYQYGQERWFTLQVEFDCALCNHVCWEWPCLDAIHGLLCHACQHSILETQRNLEQWIHHHSKKSSPSIILSQKKPTSLLSSSEKGSSIKSITRPLVIKRLLKNMFGKCSSPHKRPYSPLVH